MIDEDSISLGKYALINEGALINLCNMGYSTIPFSDEPYCKDFIEMTARLIYSLNKGHCFADGNKRTCLLIIMELIKNEYPIFYNQFFMGSLANYLLEMLSKNLDYNNILSWVSKQYELRYDISVEEQILLKIAVNFKRKGFYEEAKKTYEDLINKYGSSSVVYNGIAKVLACNKEYEEAILMFNKAIILAEKNGIDDFQSKYHKQMLESRNNMSKIDFLNYMKGISGNPDYKL